MDASQTAVWGIIQGKDKNGKDKVIQFLSEKLSLLSTIRELMIKNIGPE